MQIAALTVAALAASASALAEPAAAPGATVQNTPRQASDECRAKYSSLVQDNPPITAYPGLLPWLGDEISKAVATATPDLNLCDEFVISSTATPPPSLTAAWSSFRSEVTAWISSHRDDALSLATSCGSSTSTWAQRFEGLAVTDKAGCESLYEKYIGRVPTWPKLTGTYPPLTGAGQGTVIGGFTTVTPGAAGYTGTASAGSTAGAATGSSASGNSAPRETGFAVVAAAAVLGVVAVL